jgi:quinol monooxygenase YgiN
MALLQLQGKPNTGDQLEHYLRALVGLAQKESGTLDYVIARDSVATDLFHVYEKYTGRAAFETHIAAKEFKDFVEAGLLAVPPAPKMLKALNPL